MFTVLNYIEYHTYYPDGRLYMTEWRKNGIRCPNPTSNGSMYDKTTVVVYSKSQLPFKNMDYSAYGTIISTQTKNNNHSNEASVYWHSNGDPSFITYYNRDGKTHNKSGPASIKFCNTRQVYYIAYYLNGKLHNLYGPAEIDYYPTGKPHMIKYLNNGKLHNPNCPAVIRLSKAGKSNKYYYYTNGFSYNSSGGPKYVYIDSKKKITTVSNTERNVYYW